MAGPGLLSTAQVCKTWGFVRTCCEASSELAAFSSVLKLLTMGSWQWAVGNGRWASGSGASALTLGWCHCWHVHHCLPSWYSWQTTDASVCLSVRAGMPFDIAIRVYLDSFRLPGESQKINRIMESFGARYHMQCPELFKNPDVVYILAYSTIMLNTDQHNSQVCLCSLASLCLHASSCVRACVRVCVTCRL